MQLLGLIMIPLGLVDGTCGCPPSFPVLDLGLVASLPQTVGGDGLLLGRWTEGGNQSGDCRDLGPLWDDATRGYWIVAFCHRTLDNIGRCRPPKIYLGGPERMCGMLGVNMCGCPNKGFHWWKRLDSIMDAPRESQHVMRQGGLLCIKDGSPDWLCGVYAPTTHSFHTPVGFFFLRMAHSSLNVVQVKRSNSVSPGARCQTVL